MLVELGLVEQRYQAVLEVLNDGVAVTEVAARFGVTRQTRASVVAALRGSRGWPGLVDGSTVPGSCPHQMAPEVEARIVEMRMEHPGWGPRTIGHWLGRRGRRSGAGPVVDLSVPGPSRADHARRPASGRRPTTSVGSGPGRWSCGRWTSSAASASPMASEAKIVTGVDDHSRFCVSALVVARATARPTCDALALAMRRHGVPGADPDRQRQGVHRPVRARHR